MFVGQGGTLDAFDVSWEQGLAGYVGAEPTGRGATMTFGEGAPLSMDGPVAPGTTVGITLATPGVSACMLGIFWGYAMTPIGAYWVNPFELLVHPGFGQTLTLPIPNIPELRGLPIVTQSVQLFPVVELHNPSGVAIR